MEFSFKPKKKFSMTDLERAISYFEKAGFSLGGGRNVDYVISTKSSTIDPTKLVLIIKALSLLSDDISTFKQI